MKNQELHKLGEFNMMTPFRIEDHFGSNKIDVNIALVKANWRSRLKNCFRVWNVFDARPR